MSLQYPSYSKRMDPQKLFRFIVIVSVPILISLGILRFWQLDISDQVENLRWLSSALIQAYAAVLVLLLTIGLALLSFSAGKYSARLVKKLWKSRKMSFFFFSIAAPIAICCTILVSLSGDLSFSLQILETSFSMMKFFIVLESFTIFSFILAVYLILDDIYEAVGGHIDEVLLDLIKDIQTQNNTDETFGDIFHVLASLADNRDLVSLEKAVEKLFSLAIENDEYYEIVHEMLFDISRRYKKKDEYFCLSAVKKMIEKGYERVLESGNITLISKFSNFITEIENLKVSGLNKGKIICN